MAAVNVTFPGNLAQVQTAQDLRAIPSSFIADGDLYIVTGLQGIFEYDPGSTAPDDNLDIIRPNDKTPLQSGRWIRNVDGFASGPPGQTGPANSTYPSLATLKGAPVSNVSAILAPSDATQAYLAGTFKWTLGDFSTVADDIYVIVSDNTSVTVGAWVNISRGQPKTAFDFGGVGDGIHDDTLAIQTLNNYCEARNFAVFLAVPPVEWRTTASIVSNARGWTGMGRRIQWHFDPPAPESLDMMGMIEFPGGGMTYGVVENIDARGPHAYDLSNPSSYCADTSMGPQRSDGGWYQNFFKPGTCAFKVQGTNQPIFRNVWTSARVPRSFKVGIYADTTTGHTEIGSGCRHYDLIGVRWGRNSDDLKFRGEPIIALGMVGLLFGTSNLNGTFNGGLGLREASFYIGNCPYGILQMNDHGPVGTPLPNPGILPEGLYGTMTQCFFEFIGEACIQTLATSRCRDLTYDDMERFSWEDSYRMPISVVPENNAQLAAFRFGQLASNCRFGTTRSKPTYVSPTATNPTKSSFRFQLADADETTVIAQHLLATTAFAQVSASSRLFDRSGRTLHQGDATVRPQLLVQGNPLGDVNDPSRWSNNSGISVVGGTAALGSVPDDMAIEVGGSNGNYLRIAGGGLRRINFVANPDDTIRNQVGFLSFWAYAAAGDSALVRLVTDDNAELYPFTVTNTGGRWVHYVLGGTTKITGRGVGLEVNINSGALNLAGVMFSVGTMRPYTGSTGPSANSLLTTNAGLRVIADARLDFFPTSTTSPAAGGAGALPATPSGYITLSIDGQQRKLPYY